MGVNIVKLTIRRMRRDPLAFTILCLLGFIGFMLYMMPSPSGDVYSNSAVDELSVIDSPNAVKIQTNPHVGLPTYHADRLGEIEHFLSVFFRFLTSFLHFKSRQFRAGNQKPHR